MGIKSIIQYLRELFQDILIVLSTPLFHIGDSTINLGLIIYFVCAIIVLIYAAFKVKKLLIHRILVRYNLDIGIRQSIGTITKYLIIVIGLFIIIQSVGIDLSALGLVAGALGVGIGFGLQNITNNFISGLIILFERPIKVGDRIEVGDIKGDVQNIAARATTVVTNDNISLIVPNSEFVSSTVINWSHNDRMVRFRIPVGVAYKEDPEIIKNVLLMVAHENRGVLRDPEPDVLFEGYGDSSINFILRVWTVQYTTTPDVLTSQLYYEIFKKFREHHIEIPFPQRDLHLKSGFEREVVKV